tara:strand:+ start:317 stop:1198 length:882 start_codon:yes stop_codon:yes gene_type:complete
MSGIATSGGGGGDVFLAGDPNAFTGTNTYDVNRPTSTLTSTPAATEFITKQDADGDYALLTGTNPFTGTNTFNTNRPTSSLTSTPAATEFVTANYVDGFNEVGFEGNFNANPVVSYAVGLGNPTTTSGGDNLNGRMDTPQGFLNADITIPATGGAVKIDFCVCGEWSNISWDKGLILARAEANADGTFPNPVVYQALIRANLDTTSPNSARYLVPFVQAFGAGQDNGSTSEQAVGFVIDYGTGVVIGKTYRYTPVLINTHTIDTFKLNRVINSTNNVSEERTVSSIVASILKV